jgi:hypothetical protein
VRENHNMHPVEEHEWLIGTAGALAGAFEAATRTIENWVAEGPREPDGWRTNAGLPGPAQWRPRPS